MDDLVTWLRAQLDEDERVVARNRGLRGLGDNGTFPDYRTYDGPDLDAADDYLDMFAPPRMLAEVEAKRRILDEWRRQNEDDDPGAYLAGPIIPKLLALPYAGRGGWREEWRA